jgi:hypothetical protein
MELRNDDIRDCRINEHKAEIRINLSEAKHLLRIPEDTKIDRAYLDTFTKALVLEIE